MTLYCSLHLIFNKKIFRANTYIAPKRERNKTQSPATVRITGHTIASPRQWRTHAKIANQSRTWAAFSSTVIRQLLHSCSTAIDKEPNNNKTNAKERWERERGQDGRKIRKPRPEAGPNHEMN